MKYLKLNATSSKASNPIVSLANNKLGVSRLNDGENHLITETGNVYPDSNVCLCSPNFIQNKGKYGGNYEFSDYYNPEYLIYISRIKDVVNHKFIQGSTVQNQKRYHPEVYTNNKNVKKAYYFIQNVDIYTLFTTPFEVQNIYILETPADVNYDTTTTSRNEFMAIQEPYNDKFIYEFYKKLNQDGQPLGITDKTYGELIELVNYTGSNLMSAHYYLYYQDNPGEETTNWKSFTDIINENYTIPAKTVLSISGSTVVPDEEYSYWAGKYFVLESVDNPEITDDFDINVFPTASNMYTMCGNYTLHPVEVQLDKNCQLFDEEINRRICEVPEGQTTEILRHGNAIVKYTE